MKVETQESLVREFPCLFRNGMFFECGPGWTQLIRDLCSRLEPICLQQREAGEEFVLVAGQVKSKYGGLRFYVDGGTPVSDELINQAELRSENICEACGGDHPREECTCGSA